MPEDGNNFTVKDSAPVHRILVVECEVKAEQLLPEDCTSDFGFDVLASELITKDALASGRYAGVLALVDPGSRGSIHQLETVLAQTKAAQLTLATMSTFNPLWIENLLLRLDVRIHFREFPTDEELQTLLEIGL